MPVTTTRGSRRARGSGPDAITEFFTELASRGYEPLLQPATGSIRFDLGDGTRVERWHVTISKGNVTVSKQSLAADTVMRLDRQLFEGMVAGKANATAAQLRGALVTEGDIRLSVLFQRVFPGMPRSRPRPAATASETGRTAR